MKNRLVIAHKLLKPEGTIAISVDNYEIAYLLVLLDEILGKENRKNIITVKRGSVTGAKVINLGVVNVVEYVVLYSKEASVWKPNRVFATKGYDDRYGNIILNYEEHCVSVNDDKEADLKQILLNSLEDASNPYRAIFEVKKLDEGWDVLNLFDIVRLYETR